MFYLLLVYVSSPTLLLPHSVLGSKVDSLWLSGSREEAMRRSRQARLWNLVGMITGVVLYVFIVVLAVAVNVSASAACC